MAFLTASAIAALSAAAINGGISAYANGQSQEAMERYRNALAADRARALAGEERLENEDPLHTKAGSALSTDMAEKLKDVNEAEAGRNAVMGAGGHNAAATKNATADMMAAYQRSLIRQHEMNVVPQLNYYRSQYDRANAGLEKAQYDKSVANIQAASQAAQGMVNAVAAAGSQLGTQPSTAADAAQNAANAANGNGTQVGNIPSGGVGQPSTAAPLEPGTPTQYQTGNQKVVQMPTGEWMDEITGLPVYQR